MSEKKVVIIRVSAWRTAVSRPLASQSHWTMAGEEQIAQSGSMVSGFSRSRYGSRSLMSRVNEMDLLERDLEKVQVNWSCGYGIE